MIKRKASKKTLGKYLKINKQIIDLDKRKLKLLKEERRLKRKLK